MKISKTANPNINAIGGHIDGRDGGGVGIGSVIAMVHAMVRTDV